MHMLVSEDEQDRQQRHMGSQVWYTVSSPGEDQRLLMDILWVNKTATRLPEVQFYLPVTAHLWPLQRWIMHRVS